MNSKGFQGWQQVFLVALTVGLGNSLSAGALTITNTAMMSGGQIIINGTMFGLAYSLFSLMQGPPQPVVAKLIQRMGPRKVLMIGCLCTAVVGIVLSNFITSSIAFVVIYGVLFGLVSVITSQLAPQTFVNNWFYQRRGQAQSIMRAIATIFQAFGPYLATFVIINLGGGNFKYGWYLSGACAVIGLFIGFFLKDTPEEYGQLPDGLEENSQLRTDEKKVKLSTVYKRPIGEDVSLKEARKMLIFWLMTIASSLGFMTVMIMSFTSVHFVNNNYSLEMVSIATGIATIINILFVLLLSTIIDKIEPAYLFTLVLVLFAVCCYFAVNPMNAWIVYATIAITTVIGSCAMVIMPTIYANYFGSESFSSIQGFSLLIGGLASSTTGVIGGIIADLTGSYDLALYIYGTLALIGAGILLFGVGIPCEKKYKAVLMDK